MIFGTKQSSESKKNVSKDYGVTIITAGCHFEGKLYCKGSSRIAGTIEGEIISEGMLVIEESATIKANLITEDIIVHGEVTGSLKAKRKVELAVGSRFVGEISTPSLIIQEGAQFDGKSSTAIEDPKVSTIESIHTGKKEQFSEVSL